MIKSIDDMARYINIWKEKNVVIRLAYNCEDGHWIMEDKYMVAIEDNNGKFVMLPVMYDHSLDDTSADDYLDECEDEDTQILMPYDCSARDEIINEHITEWICNDGAVNGSTQIEAVCNVVAILARNGMWKGEYAKSIDMKRIYDKYGEED